MRIVCPSCQAAYDVPSAVVELGRTLRCARCGTEFSPTRTEAPAATAPAALPAALDPLPPAREPAPPVVERLVPQAPRQAPVAQARFRPVVLSAWLASLALLAAMAWAFFAWRESVQLAWPASARVYGVFGLR